MDSSARSTSRRHVYWAVPCKTDGKRIILVKYIGVHDGRVQYDLPSEIPHWFASSCANCGKEHTYARSELKQFLKDEPPGADFRPWF